MSTPSTRKIRGLALAIHCPNIDCMSSIEIDASTGHPKRRRTTGGVDSTLVTPVGVGVGGSGSGASSSTVMFADTKEPGSDVDIIGVLATFVTAVGTGGAFSALGTTAGEGAADSVDGPSFEVNARDGAADSVGSASAFGMQASMLSILTSATTPSANQSSSA